MDSPLPLISSSRFCVSAVLIVALGCLVAPRTAEAQLTASEVASFYEAFLGKKKTCADLHAWGGKVPSVVTKLCAKDPDSRIGLDEHLKNHINGSHPEKKALINGGGVSMGSYQAGRLQGLINDARVEALDKLFGAAVLATNPSELARVDEQLNELLVDTKWSNLGYEQVAGASAGGMNATGFAIEVCRKTLLPTFVPQDTAPSFLQKTDSVLRRMWLDVGFGESDPGSWAGGAALLRAEDLPATAPSADKNAVFSADPLDNVIKAVASIFDSSTRVALRRGCGMGVSITVTSLNPVEVPLKGMQNGSFLSVTIPVMVDLRVSSTTPEHLEVRAYAPANSTVMTVVNGDPKAFLSLVRATGALPPALPMLTLREDAATGSILFGGKRYAVSNTADSKKGQWRKVSSKNNAAPTDELNLIDGGLFNNNPLDLVLDRAQNGAIEKFLFFDQDFTEIPRPTARAKYMGNTLYVHFQRILSAAIIDVARNQQVASALRRFGNAPGVPRVESFGRQSPVLSEAGFATSAFLLREFRELDYLAGVLDANALAAHETWVSKHADVQLLRGFYGVPLSTKLDDNALVTLIDKCISQPSALALKPESWGRRCLLAGAARRAVQSIDDVCRPYPTSEECEKSSEFSALGKAARALQAAAPKKAWRFVDTLRDDIDQQLARLSDRIDETVRNQPSKLALPSRVLDVGLEALFIDGLQFMPHTFSDEKDRRVMRGRRNTVARGFITDLRIVADRSFWALEGSRRFDPWLASAVEVGGMEWGVGLVPALSLGVGPGCSTSGNFSWFTCSPQPELQEDGSFRANPTSGFGMAYGDLSAELLAMRASVISLHLGALLTARGGFVVSGEPTWGIGLETGGFLRVGLARTITLDFRLVTGLPLRTGANIAKPTGSFDSLFAAGWQF